METLVFQERQAIGRRGLSSSPTRGHPEPSADIGCIHAHGKPTERKAFTFLTDRWFSKVLRAGSALLKSQRIGGCRLHEGRTSIYRVLELKPLKPMLSLAKPRSQMTSKGQLQTGGAIRALRSDAMKMANGLRLTFFPAKKQVYGRFIRKTHPLESWIFQPRGSMGATDCVVAFDAHCAGSGKIRPSGQHVAISLATGEHSTCFVQLII